MNDVERRQSRGAGSLEVWLASERAPNPNSNWCWSPTTWSWWCLWSRDAPSEASRRGNRRPLPSSDKLVEESLAV